MLSIHLTIFSFQTSDPLTVRALCLALIERHTSPLSTEKSGELSANLSEDPTTDRAQSSSTESVKAFLKISNIMIFSTDFYVKMNSN